MRTWPKRLWTWFLEPINLFVSSDWTSWVFLITIIGSLLIIILGHGDPWKNLDTWLTSVGTIAAILGFSEILVSLGRPSFVSLTWTWLKRFPRLNQKSQTISMHLGGQNGTQASISLQVQRARPTATDAVKARIDWLESERDRLDSYTKELDQKLEEKITALSKRISAEQQERVSGHKNLDQKLSGTLVGGIPLNLFGLLCILAGQNLHYIYGILHYFSH